MADEIDIGRNLTGNVRRESSVSDSTTTTTYGVAKSDSKDGKVTVYLDGETFDVDCEPSVKQGDSVAIRLVGGVGKTPTVSGIVGGGDRQQTAIDAAQATADSGVANAAAAQTAADAAKAAADANEAALNAFKSDASSTYETQVSANKSISDLMASVASTYATKTTVQSVSDAASAAQSTADTASSKADTAQTSANTNATDLANYVTSNGAKINDLQSQIDGSIQTWFYEVAPTDSNPPASEWTTTALKNNHLGDLYYDTVSGYCYRWQVANNAYSWQRITDVDVTKALADAAAAQDTADHKRRVFVATPTTPYDVGDLWVSTDLMRCKTAKTSAQSYDAADWTVAALNATVTENYATKTELSATDSKLSASITDSYNNSKSYTDGKITTEQTDRNAAITAKADEINSTVASTYTTKTDFNALQVGGTNLLLKTKTLNGSSATRMETLKYGAATTLVTMDNGFVAAHPTSIYGGLMSSIAYLIKQCAVNDVFILSLNIAASDACAIYLYPLCYNSSNTRVFPLPSPKMCTTPASSESDSRYSIQITVTQEAIDLANAGGRIWLSVQSSNNDAITVAANLRFYAPKLERGNKATDWTPAPEDMLSTADAASTYATQSSLTQQADRITAEVAARTTTDGNVSALGTRVTQTETDISTEISARTTTDGKVSTLQTMIREYSDGVLVAKVGQAVGALVNADGSYDVVALTWNGSEPTIGITLMKANSAGFELKNNGDETVAKFGKNEVDLCANVDSTGSGAIASIKIGASAASISVDKSVEHAPLTVAAGIINLNAYNGSFSVGYGASLNFGNTTPWNVDTLGNEKILGSLSVGNASKTRSNLGIGFSPQLLWSGKTYGNIELGVNVANYKMLSIIGSTNDNSCMPTVNVYSPYSGDVVDVTTSLCGSGFRGIIRGRWTLNATGLTSTAYNGSSWQSGTGSWSWDTDDASKVYIRAVIGWV